MTEYYNKINNVARKKKKYCVNNPIFIGIINSRILVIRQTPCRAVITII